MEHCKWNIVNGSLYNVPLGRNSSLKGSAGEGRHRNSSESEDSDGLHGQQLLEKIV